MMSNSEARKRQAPAPAPSSLTDDEREALGERLMLTMTCYHGEDYFGSGAVCETCWANTQRLGRLVESILAARLAAQREQIAVEIEALTVTKDRSPDEFDRGWDGAVRNAARIVREWGAR